MCARASWASGDQVRAALPLPIPLARPRGLPHPERRPPAVISFGFVVEPNGESVVVLRAGGSIATLRGEDRIDLDAVLPGFELTVRALFDTLQLE